MFNLVVLIHHGIELFYFLLDLILELLSYAHARNNLPHLILHDIIICLVDLYLLLETCLHLSQSHLQFIVNEIFVFGGFDGSHALCLNFLPQLVDCYLVI